MLLNRKIHFSWVLCYQNIELDAGMLNSVIIMRKQVVTHPGSSCWFQMGRYFPASPPWGRWWFLCFGPGILSLRVGLRPHPISASFHCHGDQGRPRAIRRCPGDIWAGLDCSPHRRCCRRRRENPAKSSQSIRQWRVRVSSPALPPKMNEVHCDRKVRCIVIVFEVTGFVSSLGLGRKTAVIWPENPKIASLYDTAYLLL